ncbi:MULTISPECIES: cyanate hydratase [Eikenella]|uniref:Cyanate hydratase n=1 Tax=Eikenella longinqua TaxID=1795827 RepID=A0A1A9RWL7_9NEIS|nr:MULTISPECIES: cyanate hydratase [Eikenella]OAM26853.1 cyanate hydratase [Eikenella longinqua]
MPASKQAALQAAAKIKQGKTAKLKEWQAVSEQRQFANEFTVAARLGEPAFTEEQAEMVAALFGK